MNRAILERLKTQTILYAEDDRDLQGNVASYLGLIFSRVVLADDGAKAWEVFQSEPIDVVLSDLDMPQMNGIELIKRIREIDEKTPVVVMTAHTTPEYTLEAIELGLARYLVKPFVGEELLGALEKIYANERPARRELGSGTVYDYDEKAILFEGEIIGLTVKECALLELFIAHKGHLISNEMIENSVWNGEFVSDTALRALIKNLRKKLPINCISNVVGQGYKLD